MESAKAAGRAGTIIIPNPKAKRLDQVREVIRLKHSKQSVWGERRSGWSLISEVSLELGNWSLELSASQ